MILERENCKPIEAPSPKRIAAELRQLGRGRSGFASLTSDDGSYVQVAGFQVACRLEWQDRAAHRHYFAFQAPPVVTHPDGTKLGTSAGDIFMKQDEFFFMEQVIEVFIAFSQRQPFPSNIQWRDYTEQLVACGMERP